MLWLALGCQLIEARGLKSLKVCEPLKSLVTAIGIAGPFGMNRSENPPMKVVRSTRLVRLSLV